MLLSPESPVLTGANFTVPPLLMKTPSSSWGLPGPLFGFSRTTSAWIGMAIDFVRVPVMMSAEQEKPGRTSGGGSCTCTFTSKLTACDPFWAALVVMGLDPTSVTSPENVLFGYASIVTLAC